MKHIAWAAWSAARDRHGRVRQHTDLEGTDEEGDDGDTGGKYVIGGVTVRIISERIEYYGAEGNLITESYRDFTRKQIKSEFASLDDFLRHWNTAKKKQAIIELLEEHGIILEKLAELVCKEYSDFDLICHIAYDQPPLTRKERANNVKKHNYFTKYGEQARAVLTMLFSINTPTEALRALKTPRY